MMKNPCSPHRGASARGFTLTELLVVILIIIVLAAIVFPVTRAMRVSSQRSQCVTNLRSWGTVIGTYAAENNGRVAWQRWAPISHDAAGRSAYVDYWTADGDYRSGLQMHVKNRTCPGYSWKAVPGQNSPPTYAMIRPMRDGVPVAGSTADSTSDYYLAQIRDPARFLFMIDTLPNSGLNLTTAGDFSTHVKPLTEGGAQDRHRGTVNGLFGDFSVKTLRWRDIEQGASRWTQL